MKSKKIFSVILSLSLMFSVVSFCLAEENTRTFDESTFNVIKTWAENYNSKCTLPDGNDYTKCTFNDGIELVKFKDGNFKISNSTDTFANYKGDNVWIYNRKPVFYQFKDGLVEPQKALDLLLNWGNLDRKIKQQLTLPTENGIMQNASPTDSASSLWSLGRYGLIIGGLAWLGNLIYKNYKLIFGKNNKNAQTRQNAQTKQPTYYCDPNSGIYYGIDEKENFQPVYQGSAPEMMPHEKKEPQKEEKPSSPEVAEKKEDASVTKEEPSKAKLDGILKDIMKDTAV